MNAVETIRRFNRSFTQAIGLLDRSYLGRGRSLASSRLLFEIGAEGAEVRELRHRLGFDSGYMSRLLRTLERESLVRVAKDSADGRVRIANLTEQGLEEFRTLDQLSDASAAELLSRVPESKQSAFVDAFRTIERLLSAATVEINTADVHDPRAQDLLHRYYDELDRRFTGGFDPGDDPAGEQFVPPDGEFVLAVVGRRAIGCGAVVFRPEFAEIKRMWVDPEYRGIGLASRILSQLEDIARGAEATVVRLDTNGTLTEARRLYSRVGYREIERYNDNPYATHWFEKPL